MPGSTELYFKSGSQARCLGVANDIPLASESTGLKISKKNPENRIGGEGGFVLVESLKLVTKLP